MIKKEKKGAASYPGNSQKIAALYTSGLLTTEETEKMMTAAFSRFASFLRAVYDLPDEPQSRQKKGMIPQCREHPLK